MKKLNLNSERKRKEGTVASESESGLPPPTASSIKKKGRKNRGSQPSLRRTGATNPIVINKLLTVQECSTGDE